jgi:hypothetical protein
MHVFKLDLRARQRAKAVAAASAASVGGRRASLAPALDVSPHAVRGDDKYEVRAAWSPASPSSTVSGSIRSGPPGSMSPHAAAPHDGYRSTSQVAARDDTADQHALGPALSASALLLPHGRPLSARAHPLGAVLGEAGDPLRLGVSPRSPATGDAGVQPPASSNSARSQRSSGSALLASPARAEEEDGSSREDRLGKALPAAMGGEGVPHSVVAWVRDAAAKDADAGFAEVEPAKQQWAAEALAAAARSHLPELAGAREMLAAATQQAAAAEERAVAAEQAAVVDKAAVAAAAAEASRLAAALRSSGWRLREPKRRRRRRCWRHTRRGSGQTVRRRAQRRRHSCVRPRSQQQIRPIAQAHSLLRGRRNRAGTRQRSRRSWLLLLRGAGSLLCGTSPCRGCLRAVKIGLRVRAAAWAAAPAC